MNIRRLNCKLDHFQCLLASINNKFSVIGISEAWLRGTTHHADINGYDFVHKHRSDKTGGGVGLYIDSDLEYKLRDELCFTDRQICESLCVEIVNPRGKNYIIGVIYRPPSQNMAKFIDNLSIVMAKISREDKVCYLMGDFNLNLLNQRFL